MRVGHHKAVESSGEERSEERERKDRRRNLMKELD
jgi:hypothetical protein